MTKRFTRKRKALLALLAGVVLPALLLVAFEGVLRLADYPYPRPLFIPADVKIPGRAYLMVNQRVAERYFPRHQFVPEPPLERFLKEKPANAYRVFVLGDSTAAGWPYPNNVMFSRILGQRLADAFPERPIEVVNVAIAAVSSYTLLDFLDEVLAQKPDALLIYAGHNEFYGALGVASTASTGAAHAVVRLYLALARLKTVAWLREQLIGLQRHLAGAAGGEEATLMARVVAEPSIPLGGRTYRRAAEQFAANLDDILHRARTAGVPVLVSELVSNLRDHRPFVSQAFEGLPPADEVYGQAKALEAAGDFEAARQAYTRAKDLDAMRFRASEEFNDIIHRVAAKHAVPVVPMKAMFERASPNGLVGASLMLEHLHPNVEGHFLMSEAFLDAMRDHGFVSRKWDVARLKPLAHYRQEWGISELDHALGKIRVLHLMDHWPFQARMKSGDAVRNFRPGNRADEMALRVFLDRMTLREAHLSMAELHENAGRHELADLEYRALVASDPLDLDSYLRPASTLAERGQYRRALPFLEQSLKVKETAFAYQWMGQVALSEGRIAEAIPLLEKAATIEPPNPVLLFNLASAYAMTGRRKQAAEAIAWLAAQHPGHPYVESLRQKLAVPD